MNNQILTDEKLESWDTVIYERRRFYDYEINGEQVHVTVYDFAKIEDEKIDDLMSEDRLCPGCLNWHEPDVLATILDDETGRKFDICRCDEAGDPVVFGLYW